MSRKRRKRRAKALRLFRVMILVLIPVLLVYTVSIFFKVSDINVSGQMPYSSENLSQSLSYLKGKNLFFFSTGKVADTLKNEYPYLDEVVITRKIPDLLQVEVTQRENFAVVENENGHYLIDKTGKVLAEATLSDRKKYIRIFGIETEIIEGNIKLQEKKQEMIYELVTALEEKGYLDNILEIHIPNDYDISMIYDGLYSVELGTINDINYKLKIFGEFLLRLTSSDIGIIDLSSSLKTRFIPQNIELMDYVEIVTNEENSEKTEENFVENDENSIVENDELLEEEVKDNDEEEDSEKND